MRAAVVGIAALLIAGCDELAPRVTPGLAAAAHAPEPALARGREVFVTACASCHALPSPWATAAADWPRTMATMGAKSRLAPAEVDAALRYVLAVRAQPR